MKIFWLCLLLIPLQACEKKPGYHVDETVDVKVEELAEDIKLPSKAWDLLEFKPIHAEATAGAAEASTEEGHGGGEAKAAPAKNFTFSEVVVHLVQKNEGVVEGEAVKIHLPRGGGKIDLSRYINATPGTFFIGFEFPAFENATAKKVIFVSRTKKRKIGGQVFGAGCNQILDITERFLTEMKLEGIKVNTTQERYLSVVGGTFLFSAQTPENVLLAQVTFTNPQFQHLFCEEK